MFDKIIFRWLRVDEFLSYCNEIKTYLQSVDLEALPIKPMVDKFAANQEEALAASNRNKTSQFTQKLREKDHRRDESFVAFRNLMEANTHRGNEVVSTAATGICGIIRTHGWSLYAGGQKRQSGKMASLIQELDTEENQATISSLKALSWYKEMVDDNQDYAMVLEEKAKAEASEVDYDTQNVYKTLRISCEHLFESITVLNRIAADAKYTEIANFCNECTQKYMAAARSRKTKNENADKESVTNEA